MTIPSVRVPRKYAGQWIAWNHDRTQIVASGTTYLEARDAARVAGEEEPYLTRAPAAKPGRKPRMAADKLQCVAVKDLAAR